MSADRSNEQGEHAPERESLGGVVGMGLGLVLIVGAGLMALFPLTRDTDAAQLLRESFGVQGDLPYGLKPVRAVAFATGERLVLLRDPERSRAEDHAPHWTPSKSGAEWRFSFTKSEDPKVETFDWSTIPVAGEGRAPVEVALAFFPLKTGRKVVESQFHSMHFEDITQLPKSGKTVPVDSGHLDWGPFEAPYIQLRHFGRDETGPGFWDTLRVNLTVGSKARILYLRWSRGQAGHRNCALEVLRALPTGEGV